MSVKSKKIKNDGYELSADQIQKLSFSVSDSAGNGLLKANSAKTINNSNCANIQYGGRQLKFVKLGNTYLWRKPVRFHYDAAGGTVASTEELHYNGTSFSLPTPTRDNYTFNNWTDNAGNQYLSINDLNYSGNDFYLQANWTIREQYTFLSNTTTTIVNYGSEAAGLSYTDDKIQDTTLTKVQNHIGSGLWAITVPANANAFTLSFIYKLCRQDSSGNWSYFGGSGIYGSLDNFKTKNHIILKPYYGDINDTGLTTAGSNPQKWVELGNHSGENYEKQEQILRINGTKVMYSLEDVAEPKLGFLFFSGSAWNTTALFTAGQWSTTSDITTGAYVKASVDWYHKNY